MMASALTPFGLADDQVKFFDENGYLALRKWITGDLLERLQQAGSAWIERGLSTTVDDPNRFDYQFAKREVSEVFYRVDYLYDKGESAALELLGSPQLLSVVQSLSGCNFVPTYESMVFKNTGDGEAIRWQMNFHLPRSLPNRRQTI